MAQSLSDDVGGVVVKVTTSATSMLGRGLVDSVLPAVLEGLKDAKTIQSMKYFANSKAAIEKVPIPAGDLSLFIKECRKMGVKVAVTKDIGNPKNVHIYFRAGHSSLVEQAITTYCDKRFTSMNKLSIKEKIAAFINRAKEGAPPKQEALLVMPEKQRGAR